MDSIFFKTKLKSEDTLVLVTKSVSADTEAEVVDGADSESNLWR